MYITHGYFYFILHRWNQFNVENSHEFPQKFVIKTRKLNILSKFTQNISLIYSEESKFIWKEKQNKRLRWRSFIKSVRFVLYLCKIYFISWLGTCVYPLLQTGQNFIWVHRKGILLAHKTRDSVGCSLDSVYLFKKNMGDWYFKTCSYLAVGCIVSLRFDYPKKLYIL